MHEVGPAPRKPGDSKRLPAAREPRRQAWLRISTGSAWPPTPNQGGWIAGPAAHWLLPQAIGLAGLWSGRHINKLTRQPDALGLFVVCCGFAAVLVFAAEVRTSMAGSVPAAIPPSFRRGQGWRRSWHGCRNRIGAGMAAPDHIFSDVHRRQPWRQPGDLGELDHPGFQPGTVAGGVVCFPGARQVGPPGHRLRPHMGWEPGERRRRLPLYCCRRRPSRCRVCGRWLPDRWCRRR